MLEAWEFHSTLHGSTGMYEGKNQIYENLRVAGHWISMNMHRAMVTGHDHKILTKQLKLMESHLHTMQWETRQQAKDQHYPHPSQSSWYCPGCRKIDDSRSSCPLRQKEAKRKTTHNIAPGSHHRVLNNTRASFQLTLSDISNSDFTLGRHCHRHYPP